MIETARKSYPTDGESYAHGATYEWDEIYDRDDVFEAIVESLIEDLFNLSFKLGGEYFTIGDYIDPVGIVEIEHVLLDDDYGTQKHFDFVAHLVDATLSEDTQITIEKMEMK